jgi:hypothetical protein
MLIRCPGGGQCGVPVSVESARYVRQDIARSRGFLQRRMKRGAKWIARPEARRIVYIILRFALRPTFMPGFAPGFIVSLLITPLITLLIVLDCAFA